MKVGLLRFNKTYSGWPIERILRHVIYWSFWLTFYGIVNGSYYDERYLEWFLFELLTMVVKVPYTYFVAYYLFPTLLPRREYVALGVYVLVFAFVGMIALMGLYQLFPYEMPGRATVFWSTKTVYMFVDLIYVASPVVVIKMTQRYLLQEKATEQLKAEKIAAELQMLRNQLQPHFLFNTLNNIYSMVISGEKQAAGALLKLSDILSYMLYECNVDRVDLAKEVSMLRNYIELEKIRYGARLDLSFDQQGNLNGRMITPLLLIPFVENAFKHGVSRNEKSSWIRIHLQADDESISFLIENSLPDDDVDGYNLKSGIGLRNVRKRLDILYPEKYSLTINQSDSFLVKLTIQI
jgi:two-component system, LytTR family, sensor kinase